MLAYRHAFHAGNHGDVLKHVVLVQVLRHLGLKDKAFTYLDTHAGAGGYSLEGRPAQKNAEHAHGIAALWGRADLPPAVDDYVALVRRFNADGRLRQYPGSPAFAQMLVRPQDRLRLYELHPTDHRILDAFLGSHPNSHVALADGFAALKAELPPPSRRGVVLVDPSYELKSDYTRTVAALREALTRFPDAVVVLWYPQLLIVESSQFPKRALHVLDTVARRGWLHARLTVQRPDERGFGMVGSGVIVANPPFPLHASLEASLPFLVDALGRFDGASYLLEQRAA